MKSPAPRAAADDFELAQSTAMCRHLAARSRTRQTARWFNRHDPAPACSQRARPWSTPRGERATWSRVVPALANATTQPAGGGHRGRHNPRLRDNPRVGAHATDTCDGTPHLATTPPTGRRPVLEPPPMRANEESPKVTAFTEPVYAAEACSVRLRTGRNRLAVPTARELHRGPDDRLRVRRDVHLGGQLRRRDGLRRRRPADRWRPTTRGPSPRSRRRPRATTRRPTPISQVQGAPPGLAGATPGDRRGVVTAVPGPSLSSFFTGGGRLTGTTRRPREGVFVRAPAPGRRAGRRPGPVESASHRTGPKVASSQTQISDRVTVLACGPGVAPGARHVVPLGRRSPTWSASRACGDVPQDLVISEYFNFAASTRPSTRAAAERPGQFDSPTTVQSPPAHVGALADYAEAITVDDDRSQGPTPPYFRGP